MFAIEFMNIISGKTLEINDLKLKSKVSIVLLTYSSLFWLLLYPQFGHVLVVVPGQF